MGHGDPTELLGCQKLFHLKVVASCNEDPLTRNAAGHEMQVTGVGGDWEHSQPSDGFAPSDHISVFSTPKNLSV